MKGDRFNKEVTFCIKTFERQKSFERLIRSLEHVYPRAKVLVVDDSRHPYAEESLQGVNLDWMVIPVPYDIGLGAGRNMLLSFVLTEYFVLLDDDYEIGRPVFNKALAELKNTNADLVAVTLWNVNKGRKDAICQNAMVVGEWIVQTKVPLSGGKNRVGRANMVNNCFVAKTAVIRRLGWDPVFKIAGEHTDFALRSIVDDLHFRIIDIPGAYHHPDRPAEYKKMRSRSHASLLLNKYGCKELHQSDGKILPIKPGADYEKARLQAYLY